MLPIDVTFDSYKLVFEYKQIWIGYRNTLVYTVLGTFFNLLLTVSAAYGLSKKTLPGRQWITIYFLITMYFSGGLVPSYLLIKQLGLINQPYTLVILGGVSIYNLIVTRVYFSTAIPENLYEAVRIDGASEAQAYIRIALPLAMPIVAVIALYYAVSRWNSYFNAMLYITNRSLEPLQTVLRRVLILNENAMDEATLQELGAGELLDKAKRAYAAYAMKYSMVFISSLPLLVAYPFLLKYFVKGIMVGALKG